ncbi:hypothetical protein K456DRAFT_1743713 [Colletotrichum gloeosporioides 23]|nr:hypothetical protein K456DRAFT_1743713 [Colletotrichum gloeosporioides 23]
MDDYTVGWICALPIELAASHAMLDKVHKSLPMVENDTNAYILGSIGGHNVAMACLPSGQYGTNNAATVAGNMMRSFKSIRFGFMVGIGGGVPGEIDIRLGDVVVGTSVIQHDLGKIVEGSGFQGTGTPRIPPQSLLNAISKLRALHEVRDSKVMTFLREMQERYPKLVDYDFPASCQDHNHNPLIHYGAIASGNQVIKCGQRRDELAKERNVICFEMEAAGLSDTFPCVVVRGICDYSDSQKNKEWQRYAAATAAAYTKELILIVASRRPRFKIAEAHASEHTLARRKALLESLRFEQIDARHATIKKAHSKTCEWLLSEELYKQWLDPSRTPDHRGFFWISGKPGAGKSTIMKFALGRAKKAAQKNAGIIYFFFNARGDNLEKSTSGLYRSLLLQLLEKFPDLQTVLDESISTTSEHTSCPTIEEIQALLRNAIAGLGQRQVTCFIDALDECDEIEVRDMVVFFEDLGEEAIANDVQLRICFSSRHYPHIDIRYGLKLVLENQSGHSRDLESYVQSHLRAGKGNYVSDIRAKILMKAGGVFMWVVLVVQVLNTEFVRGRRSRVEQRLQEIPAGLSDLFKDILKRDSTNIPDLLLCIQWVLFAKRPLTLKEFHFAMLSGLPELQEKPCVYDSENDTDEEMRLFVTGSSKGLAEITKSTTPTVQFIHESVKDFLVKDNGLRELWPELEGNFEVLGHDRLKTCCHSHVTDGVIGQLQIPSTENLPRANSDEAKVMRQLSVEKFPFLAYATQHLFYHADVAAKDVSQDDFLDQLQLEKWIHASNLLEKYQNHRYQSTASLTYILADKNFPNLLRGYVYRHPVCDVEGERYVYPIFAALANRNWATILLEHGARIDRAALDGTPLHIACSGGHVAIVRLLLAKKAQIHDTAGLGPEAGRTPLHLAALGGHEAVVRTLVAAGAEIGRLDAKKQTPLDLASFGGHAAVAKFLADEVALVDAIE